MSTNSKTNILYLPIFWKSLLRIFIVFSLLYFELLDLVVDIKHSSITESFELDVDEVVVAAW